MHVSANVGERMREMSGYGTYSGRDCFRFSVIICLCAFSGCTEKYGMFGEMSFLGWFTESLVLIDVLWYLLKSF